MSFHDDRFPIDIAYGSIGGPGGHSHVITTDSGNDEVVGRWSRKRRSWDVSYGIKSNAQLGIVQNFYIAHGGLDNSWRFRAPHDFSTNLAATADHYLPTVSVVSLPATSTDVLLGVGDGVTTDFQLRKAYTHNGFTGYIPIYLPIVSTTAVSLNDVTQVSGYSVNPLTGIVTFTVAPTLGVNVKGGTEFDIEARFGSELDAVLPLQADNFSTGSVRSIPIVEKMNGSRINEDWLPRGGGRLTFNADTTLVQSQGSFWELVPASSGLTLDVEAASTMESGGPHYYFLNGGSDDVDITGAGAAIDTLAAGDEFELWIELVGTTKFWRTKSA